MSLEPITRQEKIIAGQDLTPITRLEKFLKNFGGSGGGGGAQPDLSQTDPTQPDYVKGVIRQESLPEGYPYKEGVTIEWDGNITGLTDYGRIYRISDKIVPYADFANAQVWYTNNGSDKRSLQVTASDMTSQGIPVYALSNKDGVAMIYCIYEDTSNEGVTMPAGMYFHRANADNYVSEFRSETIRTMSPEFLPALTSPNGTKYQLTVADDGTLSAVAQS